eukprot:Phypoly_transcript_14002.p1 GENE.Phypoly_transcript_14002~~Phypoly_transcript_14002.p1  ORF type:complete len:300 (+),score=40.08 Phypoly_transcript_14002:101-1000(+)
MANLQKITQGNVQQFLDSFDTFLLDCDGVLWRGNHLIEGISETLDFLRKKGKKLIFVTNNSTQSREQFLKKILSLGLHAVKEEIIGSAYATAAYLHEKGIKKKFYVIGEPGIGAELKEFGIPYVGGEEHRGVYSIEDIENIKIDTEVAGVIVGLDRFINYYKLSYANLVLAQKDSIFIATNSDSSLPSKNDIMLPGAGSILACVACAAEKTPTIIGKPCATMMDIIKKECHIDLKRTCMVGDRIETDIMFGKDGGTSTLFVLTGAGTLEQMKEQGEGCYADYVADSLADLLAFVNGVKS